MRPYHLGARAALAVGFAVAAFAAPAADKWPSHPIRLVVPYAPGGPSDAAGRFIADALTKELGASVVVDNRPGGGASIGAAVVAHAQPDGYTFLLGHRASVSFTPQVRKVDYDPRKDLVPVAAFSTNFTLLVARKDFPPSNMAELKALAKAKPDTVTCGTAGQGSGSHIACELLAEMLGAKLLIVHYKGSSEATTDILGGRVDMMFDPSSLQYVKAGRMKILGARGKDNGRFTAELPDVPSFAEQGYPEISDAVWVGLLAPAGTDPAIIKRVATALEKVANAPDTPAKLLPVSQFPAFVGTEELRKTIPADLKYYADLIKRLNLRAD